VSDPSLLRERYRRSSIQNQVGISRTALNGVITLTTHVSLEHGFPIR
jgi:hypothetical protein